MLNATTVVKTNTHSAFYSTKCTCMWFVGLALRGSHWVHLGFSVLNAPQVILVCKLRKTKLQQTKNPNNSFGYIIFCLQTVCWSMYCYPHLKRESVEAEGLRPCRRARLWIYPSSSNSVVLFFHNICCVVVGFFFYLPHYWKPDINICFKRN